MYIKALIISLLCLFVLASSNEETMTWNETRKLTWSDFKSSPNPKSDAVALTASGITFGYSIKTSGKRIVDFNTTVESHFYPKKSWYLKNKADNYILGHEQLHFDLTELYSRMFRQQLTTLRVNQNLRAQLKNLHTSINEELDETQKKYDTQTNHSRNPEMQKRWETFVKTELKKLDLYKS